MVRRFISNAIKMQHFSIKLLLIVCLVISVICNGCGPSVPGMKIRSVKIGDINIVDWAVLNHDGSLAIISGTRDENGVDCAVLYNVDTYERKIIWRSGTRSVDGVAFHPFKSNIVACIDREHIGLVDLETDEITLLHSFNDGHYLEYGHRYCSVVGFSMDGKLLYAVTSRLNALDVAPDDWNKDEQGPYCITEILTIDIESKEISDRMLLEGFFASAATISKTTSRVGIRGGNVAQRGSGGTAEIWDLVQKQLMQSVHHPGGSTSITFFDDFNFFTGSGPVWDPTMEWPNIIMWHIASGNHVGRFNIHRMDITSMGIVYDNIGRPYMLSGSQDRYVKLWCIWSGDIKWSSRYGFDPKVAVSGNGKRAMVFSDRVPMVIDFE